MQKLPRQFFERDTVIVAKELLGKILVCGDKKAIITETEAYIGYKDDESCHAHNKRTNRVEVLWGEAGFSYVYLIYGMYFCFNIVTEQSGYPAAVLLRGAKIIDTENLLLDGPGKLCRYLKINKEHNKIDLVTSDNITVIDSEITPKFEATKRIGISKSKEKLWRFVVNKNQLIT